MNPLHAQGFTVEEADLRLVDDVYLLNAELNLEFSDDVLEAVRSGVPLIVVMDIEFVQSRDYLWDKPTAHLEQRYRLQYHALSQQYVVQNLNSGVSASYSTLGTTLDALGHIPGLPVIDKQLLDPDLPYAVRLRARLDYSALPVPLWLDAYFNDAWQLDSDWYEFAMNGAAADDTDDGDE
jgi:hypothetical protein